MLPYLFYSGRLERFRTHLSVCAIKTIDYFNIAISYTFHTGKKVFLFGKLYVSVIL